MSSTPIPNGTADTSQPDDDDTWIDLDVLIYVLVAVIALMIVAVAAVWRSTRKQHRAIGDQWFDTLAAPEHPLAGPGAHFYPQASGNVQRPGAGSQETYAAPLSLEEELGQSVYVAPSPVKTESGPTVTQKLATYEYNEPSQMQLDSLTGGSPTGRPSDPTPEFVRLPATSPTPRAPPRPSLSPDAAAAAMISAAVMSTAPKFKMLGRALPAPPTLDVSEQRKSILQKELEARQLMAKKQTLVKQAMQTNDQLEEAKSELLVAAPQRQQAASGAAKEQQEQRLAERERKAQALTQKKQQLLDQARATNARLHAVQVAHRDATNAVGRLMQVQKKAVRVAAMEQNAQDRTRSVLDGYPAAPAKNPAANLKQNISHHRASVRRGGGGSKRNSSHPSAELKQELVRQAYLQAQEASARSRASRVPQPTPQPQPASGELIYDNLTAIDPHYDAPSARASMLSQAAVDMAEWTNSELRKLANVLKRLGTQDGSWSASDNNAPTADVRFGDLQNAAGHEFQSLAGVLFTAKKHRVISFPATSLWPGKSDHVPITLLQEESKIDILRRHSMRIQKK